LQRLVSHEESIEVALTAFSNASDIEPEEAAVVYSEILDAGVPPKDFSRWPR
jgi:hypothetical protein